MEPNSSPARRFWVALEPLHAVVYFAPEPAAAAKEVGLRGWWMGYFAGRAAPLGPVGPAPVTSMFFGFAPGMVARALPDAWKFASPEDVLRTRVAAVETVLARVLTEAGSPMAEPGQVTGPTESGESGELAELPGPDELTELTELLERAVAGCRFDGRPLAAAWAAVPRPPRLLARLWLATCVLREHRGDGHVLASVAAGLTGLEAGLTHIATGATTRELLQRARGWTDEEWDESRARLSERGLLDDAGRLTEAGAAVRREVETATDRLAAGPLEALGGADSERVVDLATRLSRVVVDTGVVPVPNPMGLPRP